MSSFRDSIISTFWNEMGKVSGFFPAEIVSIPKVDGVEVDGLVNVQPNQKIKFQTDKLPTQIPIINDVVLIQPRTNGAIIRVPKESLIGSKVGVCIVDHSIDEWREQKGESTFPTDGRRFNMNDAVCILGLYPETVPWKVAQKPNTFEIQVQQGYKLGIGDGVNELLKINYDLMTILESLIIDSGVLGSTITPIKERLEKITNII